MKIARITNLLMLLVAANLATSCTKGERMLQVESPTELLERPYPLGYPSSNPEPNSVLRTLSAGERVAVLSDSYEKDFHVYLVRDVDGIQGFVIGRQPGVREIPAN